MTFYFHFVYMPATNDQCISKISQIFCSLNFDASYFLLTAISMERSVSILYPFYNNTSRPTHQSAIVCGSLWILAILIMVLEVFVCNDGGNYLSTGSEYCFSIIIFTTVLFVMAILLMLFSSILLLIEIQKTSKYCRPPKLYIVVLLTLLIFFISVIPARVLKLLIMLEANRFTSVSITFFFVHYLCTAIYCSANPYVNVLVGRWGKVTTIKKAVEEIFQDIN
ncbi:proto-oncogene Mas-like [Discoglossus pictus]